MFVECVLLECVHRFCSLRIRSENVFSQNVFLECVLLGCVLRICSLRILKIRPSSGVQCVLTHYVLIYFRVFQMPQQIIAGSFGGGEERECIVSITNYII